MDSPFKVSIWATKTVRKQSYLAVRYPKLKYWCDIFLGHTLYILYCDTFTTLGFRHHISRRHRHKQELRHGRRCQPVMGSLNFNTIIRDNSNQYFYKSEFLSTEKRGFNTQKCRKIGPILVIMVAVILWNRQNWLKKETKKI